MERVNKMEAMRTYREMVDMRKAREVVRSLELLGVVAIVSFWGGWFLIGGIVEVMR